MNDLCKGCDVFVGYAGAGVVAKPEGKSQEWLADHCWLCGRSRDEVRRNPYDVRPGHPAHPDFTSSNGRPAAAAGEEGV